MKELKYYGLQACLALWKKRPQDIIRVYLEEGHLKTMKPVLKWCAENKKAYHIVPQQDLEKITESTHHEGVAILAREKNPLSEKIFFETLSKLGPKICILYLDGVENPHNLGSILRSCAHFGIHYVLGDEGKLPSLSPSACRVAKGGAEVVDVVYLKNASSFLNSLKQKGFALVATSSHEGSSLYETKLPEKCVWIMGSETHGVSKSLLSMATSKVEIPGTDEVESLNVSVATALCLGEYYREHRSKKK